MRNTLNIFFATLYENLPGGFMDNFSETLYDNFAYFYVGIVSVITSFIIVFLFYYVLNHPRFNKVIHWVAVLLISLIINFSYALYMSRNIFEQLGIIMNYESYFFYGFSIINVFYNAIFFFVFSLLIKWWSRNCSRTPF